jgi:hypothetical protein
MLRPFQPNINHLLRIALDNTVLVSVGALDDLDSWATVTTVGTHARFIETVYFSILKENIHHLVRRPLSIHYCSLFTFIFSADDLDRGACNEFGHGGSVLGGCFHHSN